MNQSLILEINFSVLNGVVSLQETFWSEDAGRLSKTRQVVLPSNASLEDGEDKGAGKCLEEVGV